MGVKIRTLEHPWGRRRFDKMSCNDRTYTKNQFRLKNLQRLFHFPFVDVM